MSSFESFKVTLLVFLSCIVENLIPIMHSWCFTVGLDAAGKTTILYKLKLGEIVTTIPTIGKKTGKHVTPLAHLYDLRAVLMDRLRSMDCLLSISHMSIPSSTGFNYEFALLLSPFMICQHPNPSYMWFL